MAMSERQNLSSERVATIVGKLGVIVTQTKRVIHQSRSTIDVSRARIARAEEIIKESFTDEP